MNRAYGPVPYNEQFYNPAYGGPLFEIFVLNKKMNDSKIILLTEKFNSLQLSKNIDFDKFNQYAITHRSTTIERVP